jgi:TolB-like protein/Flp pilus assembly protein TadD
VDRAIQRSLALAPADRFATATDFGRALQPGTGDAPTVVTAGATPGRRRLPVAAIALGLGFLIGVGVLFAWRRTHASASDTSGPRVLAVLPFENLGDSADDYFADGVTEEVRGKLAKVPGLEVIARQSSDEFRRSSKRPQEIARELGADYLLTATVRWEKHAGGASRVRVTPELVDAGPGHAPRTKWQEPFDASLTDVFQVQADIAGKVASALDVALGDSTRRDLAAKPTDNLAAYDAFLKGEAVSEGMGVGDPASLRQAMQFYQQAVSLDSGFVEAWSQLARAAAFLYANGTPTPELAALALHAAQRAESLAPYRPEGQLALSTYYLAVLDNERSYEAAQAALKIAPNNIDALGAAALIEPRVNRWDAALEHLAKAGALDPRSIKTARRTGVLLTLLRRYPEATAATARALALAPTNLAVIHARAALALAQGDLPGARAVVKSALTRVDSAALIAYFGNFQDLYWALDDAEQRLLLRLPFSAFDNDRATWGVVLAQTWFLRGDTAKGRAYTDSARIGSEEELRAAPTDPQRHVFHGLELAYLGRKKEALAEGEYAVSSLPMSRDGYDGAYLQHQLVRIYLLVGEPEKALDKLEPLLEVPYYLSPAWLRIDPNFAPLRGNPRFEKLASGN